MYVYGEYAVDAYGNLFLITGWTAEVDKPIRVHRMMVAREIAERELRNARSRVADIQAALDRLDVTLGVITDV